MQLLDATHHQPSCWLYIPCESDQGCWIAMHLAWYGCRWISPSTFTDIFTEGRQGMLSCRLGWQVLTRRQAAQLLVQAQPFKVDMLSFTLAALDQLPCPAALVRLPGLPLHLS